MFKLSSCRSWKAQVHACRWEQQAVGSTHTFAWLSWQPVEGVRSFPLLLVALSQEDRAPVPLSQEPLSPVLGEMTQGRGLPKRSALLPEAQQLQEAFSTCGVWRFRCVLPLDLAAGRAPETDDLQLTPSQGLAWPACLFPNPHSPPGAVSMQGRNPKSSRRAGLLCTPDPQATCLGAGMGDRAPSCARQRKSLLPCQLFPSAGVSRLPVGQNTLLSAAQSGCCSSSWRHLGSAPSPWHQSLRQNLQHMESCNQHRLFKVLLITCPLLLAC